MVAASRLVSLGVGLLLAASPAAAQTASTSTTVTLSGSSTMATVTVTNSTVVPTATPTSCAAGLQMFVARGSNEYPGLGRIGVVARNISERIPGSSITAVDYPATFVNYSSSVANGTVKLRSLVTDYASKCPNGKMALLGYSQGAQAVGDLICGTSSAQFAATQDLDGRYENSIVAIILFGDPTRAPGQSWDLGTAGNESSYFPRLDNAACAPYSSAMRSWCDSGDVYCALGNLTEVHGSYFNKYTQDATNFAVSQFNASQSSTTTASTTTGSATASGGAAPTGTTPANDASLLRNVGSGPAWFVLVSVLACQLFI